LAAESANAGAWKTGAIVQQRPTAAHRYLRMRVRADVVAQRCRLEQRSQLAS